MYFYGEDNKRVRYILGDLIGGEQYGSVYKLSDSECIKIYKKGQVGDKEILTFINGLGLKNFYKIYRLLYNKKGDFRAHTMKYYEDGNVDILTMPVEYVLYNLYNIYESVVKLTENNIFISDMHTGNIVLGRDEITIIDVDIYTFNRFFSSVKLREKNTFALKYLFEAIFLEALRNYHSDEATFTACQRIGSIFEVYSPSALDRTCKKLIRYKYPIDYVRKGR